MQWVFLLVVRAWCVTLQDLVQSALDGVQRLHLRGRPDGSGKTFTIFGTEGDPGLTPQAVDELFNLIEKASKKATFTIKVCAKWRCAAGPVLCWTSCSATLSTGSGHCAVPCSIILHCTVFYCTVLV